MAISRGFVAGLFSKKESPFADRFDLYTNTKDLLRKALERKQVRLNQKAAMHPHL